ncbi:hypothetical protein DL766_006583 [Monosporascus sp. MC13-8B]|uniref:Uncharacterized protein n=1 Tax=Monosporascus cannonballus TaxID=155416 RepID=A0ABY0GUQ5_9PEZI|nr:hypothetical protein DL762_010549 [Monosporascus cannonballus]RYP26872.1 hypothetical protein DL766_006583 [Monosporascus sp. MC13-8B]
MDAQNAVEPASTKQPAPASPKRGADESSHDAKSNINTTTTNTTAIAAPAPATNSVKPLVNEHASITARDASRPAANPSNTCDDSEAGPDQNSDAETIVLPGKGSISPSKPRQGKVIKHEDKSDGEVDDALPTFKKSSKDGRDGKRNGNGNGGPTDGDEVSSTLSRKNRLLEHEPLPRSKDNSSGLSSAPPSPPSHHRGNGTQQSSHRRRRSGDAYSESGSETSKPRSHSRAALKDKPKSVDRLLPGKRKAPKVESDDEGESRKARRPRASDATVEATRERENKSSSSSRQHHDKQLSRNRSASPQERSHRRSLSTQLPAQSPANGLSSKKRRIPAPLQSADYHSDDSSTGGSPHPRSSKLRNIATPLTGESTVSPARMAPHKKHVDNHGQTLFAKACAKGEYETAKRRLAERPEDLNFADYAGNTPLQVAALNGHENIVKLLIEAGCKLDCRNSDKDTPLLDAVENGHLGVVKLLLEAGVNPRKADAEGHEPLDKVPDDLENAEEIRAALREAKEKMGELRRTSEDHQTQDVQQDTVSSHGTESPRRSPAAPAGQRRGGTVRATKTSNHLLYMSLDEKTLRQAAARGDEETVTRVLLVREGCNDPEALVNAARGGHDVVMELLLALGQADPDPSPVSGLPAQYSTPMLAAIGQENTKCIKLLLDQTDFDPTRRFKGETYYEIARRREGPMWKEEEHMLKEAYDARKKAPKSSSKNKSPGRRDRETETESRRTARNSDGNRPARRGPSSPSREVETAKRHGSSKVSGSPKEKRRSSSFGNDEQISPKRGPGRPKKEDRVASDREHSPVATKSAPSKSKRAESDLIAGSSDGEAVKPRRKLISGKDLKGEREKQRRASLALNNSAPDRADSRNDESLEKPRSDRLSEKYHDRTKALKRDESHDRLTVVDSSSKRHRPSVSPSRYEPGDKEDSEAPMKRRKLDSDSRERRHPQASSPERKHKRDPSREPPKRPRPQEGERKEPSKIKRSDRDRREFETSSPSEKASITVFSEKPDIEMQDAPAVASSENNRDQVEKERKETERREMEDREAERREAERREAEKREAEKREAERREAERAAEEAKIQEDERQRREQEAKRREEEERRQREAAEKRRLEEEEEQNRLQAEEKRRREEEEKVRLEEERRQKEELERRRLEEEKRREEEEHARRREQEEKDRRIKEAEEARRLREEEERKERDRKRAAREAEREAEMQRMRLEQERIRLSKLPPLLRWLEGCPNPKQTEFAKLFAIAQGVRYDTIKPEATGTAEGREQWLLNTQVALLLGEKDLSLSRYTGWEKIKVSNVAKRVIWRLESDRYALTQGKLYDLGRQLPDDYYGGDPSKVGYQRLEHLRGEASKLFLEADMWFVKVSDFLYIVPTVPHLRDVKISIDYREIPEDESALATFNAPSKWKQDPDAASRGPFAPRYKYYVNGQLVGEDRPKSYTPSRDPFPEHRVPRRGGLITVTADESDYARLCIEQGLSHLLTEQQKQSVLNGAHLTPRSLASTEHADYSDANISPTSRSPRVPQVNGIKGAHDSPNAD